MNDLINRQTAIERIRGQMIHGVACGKEIQEYYEGLSCAVNILAGLPTAEPEIIRCKDCKYYGSEPYSNDWCVVWGNTTSEFSYCSYAERKVEPAIVEQLYQHKCYITDKEGLQHEVIHTGDIRRITGWEI